MCDIVIYLKYGIVFFKFGCGVEIGELLFEYCWNFIRFYINYVWKILLLCGVVGFLVLKLLIGYLWNVEVIFKLMFEFV